uniref:RNA-binding protein 42 n=1 Tax=Syphacia muris TaxID=451379 RepID=A0A0N5AFQ9_9BILA
MSTANGLDFDEEFALFEKEIASLDSKNVQSVSGDSELSNDAYAPSPSTSVDAQNDERSGSAEPLVSGPMLPANGVKSSSSTQPATSSTASRSSTTARSSAQPFLPHVMLRPGYAPPPSFTMRFMPQLRLPLPPGFLRPPMQLTPQPPVLESGPSLYDDSKKTEESKNEEVEDEKSKSTPKTQVLSSDIELVAQKKHNEAANRSSFLGQVMRGEKKMKRFLRVGGGQVWEDPSLAEWDPNDFRIFCGDLGNEVSDELLAKAFRKYPSFQKAKVIRESKTNKSKGYGFVSFKAQDDFVRAMREMDGKYVGNRPIKLRKSNWKERSLEVVKKKQKQRQKLGLL